MGEVEGKAWVGKKAQNREQKRRGNPFSLADVRAGVKGRGYCTKGRGRAARGGGLCGAGLGGSAGAVVLEHLVEEGVHLGEAARLAEHEQHRVVRDHVRLLAGAGQASGSIRASFHHK